MIDVACPHCAQPYTVRPELAGRRSTCRGCGERIEVPQPEAPPAPPEASEILDVPDTLLPSDYGGDPLAEGEQTDDVQLADADNSWGAESPRRAPPPEEEKLPTV